MPPHWQRHAALSDTGAYRPRRARELIHIAVSRSQGRNIGRSDGPRVNHEITGYRACRLIGQDGKQLGIFDVRDAYDMALDEGLDLVEMSADAQPPVCKIMDFSKYRYEQQKKAKANRHKSQETKQMKFRCNISDGDYETKRKHVVRFLEEGNRVRITIMFRGREMSHTEIGQEILDRLVRDVGDLATVTQAPLMDRRDMIMVLAPTQEAIGRGAQRRAEASGGSRRRRKGRQSGEDSQ